MDPLETVERYVGATPILSRPSSTPACSNAARYPPPDSAIPTRLRFHADVIQQAREPTLVAGQGALLTSKSAAEITNHEDNVSVSPAPRPAGDSCLSVPSYRSRQPGPEALCRALRYTDFPVWQRLEPCTPRLVRSLVADALQVVRECRPVEFLRVLSSNWPSITRLASLPARESTHDFFGRIKDSTQAHLSSYLNYHRPSSFATMSLDLRGKRKRSTNRKATPRRKRSRSLCRGGAASIGMGSALPVSKSCSSSTGVLPINRRMLVSTILALGSSLVCPGAYLRNAEVRSSTAVRRLPCDT